MNMEIAERESKRKMSQIDDETYMHHEKALTDADAYRRAKTAEGNAAVFTEAYLKVRFQAAALSSEFFFFPLALEPWLVVLLYSYAMSLQLEMIRSVANNTKIYFGAWGLDASLCPLR